MSEALLSAALLRECERLALIVAPELAAAPLYAANLPPNFPATGQVAAFITRGAPNFILRDALIAEGRWHGPGTVVTFCAPMARHNALGLMLHEIAHVLPFTEPPADYEPSPMLRKLQRELIELQLNRPANDSPDMPAWYNRHGIKFHRVALHLHARAWQAGYEIGLPEIQIFGEQYDLSAAWKYMHALRDECERMQTPTFAQIAAEQPPAEFLELWRADFREWNKRTKQIHNSPSPNLENESHVNAA
jgi:hypothetical protein